jgi:hypothetical protein
MRLEDLKGKLVLFKLSSEMKNDLTLFQIYSEDLWAVVVEIENEGIWIENPAYEIGIWWDENGNLIPQDKQIKEEVKTNILILWRYIRCIMSVKDPRFQKIESAELPGFKAYKG